MLIYFCLAVSGHAGTQLSPPSYGVGPDVKLLGEDTAVQYIIDEGKITGNKSENSTNPTTRPTAKTTKSPSTTEKQQTAKTDKPNSKSEEDKNQTATSTGKSTELNTMKSTNPSGQVYLTSEASMGKLTTMTITKQPTTEHHVESTTTGYSSAQNNICNIWLISVVISIYSTL